jgi:predicted amidohydrolase
MTEQNNTPVAKLLFFPGDIVEIQSTDKRIDEDDHFCLYLRVRGIQIGMDFCPDYYFDDIPLTLVVGGVTLVNPSIYWSSFHGALAIDCHEYWEQEKLIKAQIEEVKKHD